jgi:HK97 family phage major capsid protein
VFIPRITTGSLTGFQTQDNQALANQDLATAMVEAPVRTVGGYQDYALQLLEQSPMAFDQLIYEDLMADMDLRVDIGCLNGDGGPATSSGS